MTESDTDTGSLAWYMAELVVRIMVEGEDHVVIHRNFVLLKAPNDEAAHRRADELGRDYETTYANPVGAKVELVFDGIAELLPVYEDLEDGAEVWYTEKVVPASTVRVDIPKKNELGVFRPRTPSDVDYRAGEVVEAMTELGGKHD
jgi:hypothetical protein